MLKSLVLAVAVLGATGCMSANRNWSTTSKVTTTTMVATLAADWADTRNITADCAESNMLMGSCGENVTADAYFLLSTLVLVGATYVMPNKYRPYFTVGISAMETKALYFNARAGYYPVPGMHP